MNRMPALRFGREDGAAGGGVSGHGGNFFELESGHETWGGRDTAPAVEVPTGAEVVDLGAQRDVEDHFSGAVIELLRKSQDRELAEFLAVGRAPDGNVEGFLFDLIGDGEDAEECAGFGLGDLDGLADGVGFESGVGGDEREFEGHELFTFDEPPPQKAGPT